MTGEIYASWCCGVLFSPGVGDDNIFENDGPPGDAVRHGQCPICGSWAPKLDMIRGFRE